MRAGFKFEVESLPLLWGTVFSYGVWIIWMGFFWCANNRRIISTVNYSRKNNINLKLLCK